jgi:hypothetical protein
MSANGPTGETRNVSASDIWTGDVLLPGTKIVTKLQRTPGGMRITVADIVPGDNDAVPLEVKDELDVTCAASEQLGVIRGRPLVNGMHMTQFDVDGKCHGGAHPALEQRLRAEGRMAP